VCLERDVTVKINSDILGGIIILFAVTFGCIDWVMATGSFTFADVLPWAMWMIIGLVISLAAEEC